MLAIWSGLALFVLLGTLLPSNIATNFLATEVQCCTSVKRTCPAGLYAEAFVTYFRETASCGELSDKIGQDYKSRILESDIIVTGDSFFNDLRSGYDVVHGFSQFAPDLKVLNISNAPYANLVSLLKVQGLFDILGRKRRVYLLEVVERATPQRLLSVNNIREEVPLPNFQKIKSQLSNFLFTPNMNFSDRLSHFAKRNIFVFPIYRWLQNIRFNILGELGSDDIYPIYSRNPPMIFLKESVDFNKSVKNQKSISEAIVELKKLQQTLSKYNVQLLISVIPNKFSLYGHFAEKDYQYDGYIRVFEAELKKQNIFVFSAYDLFHANPQTVYYYQSDTHWNNLGRDNYYRALTAYIKNVL